MVWTTVGARPVDRQFASLCRAAGLLDLIDDLRFATNESRVAHRGELAELLSVQFVRDETATWLKRLAAAAVPSAPINNVGEALNEPQTEVSGMLQSVKHPSGPLQLLGSAFKIDGTRPSIRRAPPLLGEHTDEVLARLRASSDNSHDAPADRP